MGDGSRGCLWEYFCSCESSAVRMVLALAAKKDLDVLQYDVPTALLNSPVDDTIFVKMVPGREETERTEFTK